MTNNLQKVRTIHKECIGMCKPLFVSCKLGNQPIKINTTDNKVSQHRYLRYARWSFLLVSLGWHGNMKSVHDILCFLALHFHLHSLSQKLVTGFSFDSHHAFFIDCTHGKKCYPCMYKRNQTMILLKRQRITCIIQTTEVILIWNVSRLLPLIRRGAGERRLSHLHPLWVRGRRRLTFQTKVIPKQRNHHHHSLL